MNYIIIKMVISTMKIKAKIRKEKKKIYVNQYKKEISEVHFSM